MSRAEALLAKYEEEVEATWRRMTPESRELCERAEKYIPGVALRSHSTGTYPSYGERVDGCYQYDIDGNRYLDLSLGMTSIIGHNHPEVAGAGAKGTRVIHARARKRHPCHSSSNQALRTRFNAMGEQLAEGIRAILQELGIRGQVIGYGNHQSVHLTTADEVVDPVAYSRAANTPGLKQAMAQYRRSHRAAEKVLDQLNKLSRVRIHMQVVRTIDSCKFKVIEPAGQSLQVCPVPLQPVVGSNNQDFSIK